MKRITFYLSLLFACLGVTTASAEVSVPLLERTGWVITTSGEGDDSGCGHASHIIDGNKRTFWHSRWNGMGNASGDGSFTLPQFFQVDLASAVTFRTLVYTPRWNGTTNANGDATHIKVWVSDTPFVTAEEGKTSMSGASASSVVSALSDPIIDQDLSYTGVTSQPTFYIDLGSDVTKQYILFVVTASGGDTPNKFANCAEFNLSTETADDVEKYSIAAQMESVISGVTPSDALGFYSQSTIDAANMAISNVASLTLAEMQAASAAFQRNNPVADKLYRIVSAYPGFETQQGVKKGIYGGGAQLRWGNVDLTNARQYFFMTPTGDGTYNLQCANDDYYVSGVSSSTYVMSKSAANVQLVWAGEGLANFRVGSSGPFHANNHGNGSGTGDRIIPYGTFGSETTGASTWNIVEATLDEIKQITYTRDYDFPSDKVVGDYNITAEEAQPVLDLIADASTLEDATVIVRDRLPMTASESAGTRVLSTDKYYRLVCVSPKTGNSGDVSYTTLSYSPSTERVVTRPYSKATVNEIWKFETSEGGNYYIKNLNGGKYLPAVNSGNSDAQCLSLSAEKVEYALTKYTGTQHKLKPTSAWYPLFAENHPSWDYGVMAWDNGANSASAWLIYEAEDLEVSLNTVGDKSYASVYLPFPVQANGVNAYTGIISGNVLGLKPQTGVIPAETGMVLRSDAAATSTNLLIGGTPGEIGTNSLGGSLSEITSNLNNYLVLGVGETSSTIGFYSLNSSVTSIPANKAFLVNGGSAISLDFDGMFTSVEGATVEGTEADAPIYDLQGRRVMKLNKGQIYLRGSKKFIAH